MVPGANGPGKVGTGPVGVSRQVAQDSGERVRDQPPPHRPCGQSRVPCVTGGEVTVAGDLTEVA